MRVIKKQHANGKSISTTFLDLSKLHKNKLEMIDRSLTDTSILYLCRCEITLNLAMTKIHYWQSKYI